VIRLGEEILIVKVTEGSNAALASLRSSAAARLSATAAANAGSFACASRIASSRVSGASVFDGDSICAVAHGSAKPARRAAAMNRRQDLSIQFHSIRCILKDVLKAKMFQLMSKRRENVRFPARDFSGIRP
jgi:hypothetical protein